MEEIMKKLVILFLLGVLIGVQSNVSAEAQEVASKQSTVSITFVENPNTKLLKEDNEDGVKLRTTNSSKIYVKSKEDKTLTLDTEKDEVKSEGDNKFKIIKDLHKYSVGVDYIEIQEGILDKLSGVDLLIVNAP